MKRLFEVRKRLVVYLAKATHYHLEKKAGGKGKVGALVRALIEREVFK